MNPELAFHRQSHNPGYLQFLNDLPNVFIFIVRAPLHVIINEYRSIGVDSLLPLAERDLEEFLLSRQDSGDVHFIHPPHPDLPGPPRRITPVLVVVRGPIDNMLRRSTDFMVEHVLSVPKDVLNNFLDEHRKTGALQLVPAQSWSADYESAPSTRLRRLPDTVYVRWPYFGRLSAASTRIRVGRNPRQQAAGSIDADGVAIVRSSTHGQHANAALNSDNDNDIGNTSSDSSDLRESISVQPRRASARLKASTTASTTASTSATSDTRRSQRLENLRLVSSCPNCKGKKAHRH
ncbi:hypothetical protein JR316_0012693 [Psilocybe cubensis]|uniref:Uncharacterized protein n=2 Tax=Psilocybe cubensis TaxID=181762 RepID=A0ACB8GJ79_PSICU|nr:hypothetical protein JR316_0012693 [Psilocybe cubensis]KAH9475576.1 hypothetical protein JR316_0012693 [Psilocybe cubensis]